MGRLRHWLLLVAALGGLTACIPQVKTPAAEEGGGTVLAEYRFPAEEDPHEGTWLIWPHHHTYGVEYREEIEGIWLEMTAALCTGEMVHIVAYDAAEQRRITALLQAEQISMGRVDFVIAKSDDVWSRDTGPMFVLDRQGELVVADFSFDGWGGKVPHQKDDQIPQVVAAARGLPLCSVDDFVLEGGSVEMDGSGTAMLCKSSVVSASRNPTKHIAEAEAYLTRYLGATNFIWLEGVEGEDITDAHIDGMARFFDDHTLLTVSEDDFYELYEAVRPEDYQVLCAAKNSAGEPYERIELPMTAEDVKGLGYKGSYLNYYVGNRVVLVPAYGDENDAPAARRLAELYPERAIVPIDVTALYQYGGMLHCVTQQQPQT